MKLENGDTSISWKLCTLPWMGFRDWSVIQWRYTCLHGRISEKKHSANLLTKISVGNLQLVFGGNQAWHHIVGAFMIEQMSSMQKVEMPSETKTSGCRHVTRLWLLRFDFVGLLEPIVSFICTLQLNMFSQLHNPTREPAYLPAHPIPDVWWDPLLNQVLLGDVDFIQGKELMGV